MLQDKELKPEGAKIKGKYALSLRELSNQPNYIVLKF